MNNETTKGALAGIRVVDLTAVVMGPYATQIMADHGADVIKIEPLAGDDIRHVASVPEPGMNGLFANINRGKRSVTLDLRSEAGKQALRALIATADVFIHSMRGKAIAKLGFDYATVSAIKPDIVYVNGYGFGRGGPYADKAAYDDTMQAECGLTSVQAMMTGEPGFVGTIAADKVTGLHLIYATMIALFHRERTGEGQEVEVPMFESMASFMLVEHASGALFAKPGQAKPHYRRVISANRKPYRTRDGHIAALIYNDRHWASFMAAVKPAWEDPALATLAARSREVDRVYGLLAETFLERTTAEWLALLEANGIPAAPLRSIDDLLVDPHLDAVGFYETVDSNYGPGRFPASPISLSRTPARVRGPAPRLGEHNDEVLASLAP